MRWSGMAVVLLSAGGMVAQAPVERRVPVGRDGQVPVIRVQTRLVNVAVNVEDEKGAPVAGLGRDDFEVLEDGRVQKVAVFEKESASPLSVVLAIDASESVLRDERMERNAAKHFVRALLREQDELDLMDFGDTVREIVPFTNERKRIEAGLGELQRGDATALYNAIYLGADRLSTRPETDGRRRVLVVISDGGDTVKGVRYGQALEEAQRAGALVYSIIVLPVVADAGRNEGGEHALIQMSEDTGGKYYYAAEAKDLEPAFAQVSDDLRTQYVLGYYAPEQKEGAAEYRRIQVRMKDPGLAARYRLRYRTGYYADTR